MKLFLWFLRFFYRPRPEAERIPPEQLGDYIEDAAEVIGDEVDDLVILDTIPQPLPEPVPELEPAHKARFLWCLDNGHGMHQKGKRSPRIEGYDDPRFYEWRFTRDIVRRIAERCDELGIRYFITVPEVKVGSFLRERVRRANNHLSTLPKVFVSIHANAGPAPSIEHWADSGDGIETWFANGSLRGKRLARIFQTAMVATTKLRDRGVRTKLRRQFYVLTQTNMPAILTEGPFMNNPEEVHLLMDDAWRQAWAEAHVQAMLDVEANGLG